MSKTVFSNSNYTDDFDEDAQAHDREYVTPSVSDQKQVIKSQKKSVADAA